MPATFQQRLGLTSSPRPAAVVFSLGVVAHAIEQVFLTRAGPLPILFTAPLVGTLVYIQFQEGTVRQLVSLLLWGVVSSGIAVLVVYLSIVGYVLPRPMTGLEMVVFDFGMFLWFVIGLTAMYGLGARTTGKWRLGGIALSPLVQALFGALIVLLVETGIYA